MKKKTTKMSKVIENNITDLKKTFKELRADKDYYSLGQIFWDIFLFENRKSELFKAADKLWDSLTEEEQEMCD